MSRQSKTESGKEKAIAIMPETLLCGLIPRPEPFCQKCCGETFELCERIRNNAVPASKYKWLRTSEPSVCACILHVSPWLYQPDFLRYKRRFLQTVSSYLFELHQALFGETSFGALLRRSHIRLVPVLQFVDRNILRNESPFSFASDSPFKDI